MTFDIYNPDDNKIVTKEKELISSQKRLLRNRQIDGKKPARAVKVLLAYYESFYLTRDVSKCALLKIKRNRFQFFINENRIERFGSVKYDVGQHI